MIYGAISGEDTELLRLLDLTVESDLAGDLNLGLSDQARDFFADEPIPSRFHHPSLFSAGPLRHRHQGGNLSNQLAWAENAGETRALAVVTTPNDFNGSLGWLRGSVTCDETKRGGLLPTPLGKQYFASEALGRAVLSELGIGICVKREAEMRTPIGVIARSRNSWAFATYNPDGAEVAYSFHHGAPAPLGIRVLVENKTSHFQPDAASLHECRVFVQQQTESTVYVREVPFIMAGVRRRWMVSGLENATLRFFPDVSCASSAKFLVNPVFPYLVGEFRPFRAVSSADGCYFEVHNVSGTLLISW